MKHEDIRHKLSDYIDDAVSPGEKTAIDEHLKACASCSEALAELRKTIEQVKQLEEVEAPAWMTQKIMAKVRTESEERKGLFHRLFYPLSVKLPIQAVGVLFLTVTAYYIYTGTRPAEQNTEAPAERIAKHEAAPKERDAPRRNAPEGPAPREKKVVQGPGYKSLDMKYSYEKPAAPVPAEEPAKAPEASTPAKRVEPMLAKDEAAPAARSAAPRDAPPSMSAEQAGPSAGRVTAPAASRTAEKTEGKAKATAADREAEDQLDVTEHFVRRDLPDKMKVKGLKYHTRKFDPAIAGLSWMQDTKAFRSVPCASRYVVEVDLSGAQSKYLYCSDHSQIRLLGIFEWRQDRWLENRP